MPLGEVGTAVASARMDGTPYSYLAHLVTLPVRVGDVEARFALDTGIGPTLLGEALAHEVGCATRRPTPGDACPARR